MCAVLCANDNKYLKHYEMSIEKLAICHKAKSWKKPYEAEARIIATVGKNYKTLKDTLHVVTIAHSQLSWEAI